MAIQLAGNTVIHDNQNVQVSGVTTASSFVGDGSQLTNLPASGGTLEATASGTLADGSKVIVNADGTVSVVAQSSSQSETTGPGVGAPAIFNSVGSSQEMSSGYDSTNEKVVVSYKDAFTNYGMVVVGTVSGTSISFGTPVTFNSGFTTYTNTIYDSSAGKIVIFYRDDGNNGYGRAIVGTVSGTSISLGTTVAFKSASAHFVSAVFDSSNNKIVVAYRDAGDNNRGKAIVGTVSGTSISFGSEVIFEYGATSYITSTFDSTNNKVVIAYTDGGTPSDIRGRAIVGTVSGTSISFGSDTSLHNGYLSDASATFDSSNGKVVIAYRNTNNSHYGTAIVGEVSGTSISFGSPVVFNSNGRIEPISAVFDSSIGKVVISYRDHNNSQYGTVSLGTVSGNSISFDTPVIYNAAASDRNTSVYDPVSQKVIIAYQDDGNSQKGTAVVFSLTGVSIPQLGSYTNFYTSDTDSPNAAYDPVNGKVVVVYRGDTSNNIYGIVGTVSGTSISFGTPVQLSSSNPTYYNQIVYDANAERFVIAWSRLSSAVNSSGASVVAQVSGDTLVVGSDSFFTGTGEPTVNQMSFTDTWLVYDPDSQKVVVSYIYDVENEYGKSKIGTVDPSTNSITWSSGDTWSSSSCRAGSLVYDTNANKFVVFYADKSNSNRLSAKVGTMNGSGTSITWGSQITPEAVYSAYISSIYVPNIQKILIVYTKSNAGSPNWNWSGRAIVGTISGTSMSFGSPIEWISNEAVHMNMAYDSNKQNIVFIFRDQTNNYAKLLPITISGTTPSFGSATTFTTHGAGNKLTHTTNGNMVLVVEDQANSNYGRALVYNQVTMTTTTTTNLTSENFIGISDASYTNGQTATIQISGSIDDAQSGLTPGQKYYVQGDGTLSETADDPSVFAGTAVASTKLIING